MVLTQEKLLAPKELGEIVGLSPAQVRALMNEGRLEFVEISSKTKKVDDNRLGALPAERSGGAAVRWISDRGARDHHISKKKQPLDCQAASTRRAQSRQL